jgi:OOP family OmpA-OmpF porin
MPYVLLLMFEIFLLLFLYGVLLDPVTSFAQENLIRNGSFEELSRCPDGNYTFPAKYWSVLYGTPDLFASCVRSSGALAVPANFEGTRSTFTGYNYAGIVVLFAGDRLREKQRYRVTEAIYTRTIKTLKAGRRYKISFAISLADSADFCTDSLYCSLSDKGPVAAKAVKNTLGKWEKFEKSDQYGCSLNFSCKGCWNMVEVAFVAKSGYNYLSIGLPRAKYSKIQYLQDVAKPIRTLSTSKWAQLSAYYYLDNIQLIEE